MEEKTNLIPSVKHEHELKKAYEIVSNYFGEVCDHLTNSIILSYKNIDYIEKEAPDLTDDAWKAYFSALRNTLTGGVPSSAPNLQLTTGTEIIRWDEQRFGDYYFHVEASDRIPALGSKYKKSSMSFVKRYQSLLTGLYVPDPDEEEFENAQAALVRVRDAISDADDLRISIALEWQALDDRQRASGRIWYTVDDYYENRRAVLDASERIVNVRWADFYHHIQLAFRGSENLIRAIKEFQTAQQIEVNYPRNNEQVEGKYLVYPYQISKDFPTWLKDAREGRLERAEFSISLRSHRENYSHQSISGGIGIGIGFFGIIGVGHRTTTRIDTTRTEFHLDFSAVINTFSVHPGGWFSREIMDLYSDGPFVPGSAIERKYEAGNLFGHKGFISYRPSKFVIAYKPVVKVKMSYDDYHYFHQVTRGVAAFAIGPFVVGVGHYYDEQRNVTWDNSELSITLYDAPEYPILLAVDSEQLY